MDLELTGKRAIVTGGSRGIGKAVARALAGEGTRVVIVARDAQALAQSAAELSADTGSDVFPITADTGSDASVGDMVALAVERLGGIDILVNAAAQPGGQAAPPRLADIGDDLFWPDVNVKVMGYLRCIREVVPHMVAQGGGRVINVSGLAARATGSTIGSIRNVAVAALTKNLADELGPRGISVIVVHPGLTRTEKTAGIVSTTAARRGMSEQAVESEMSAANVLGRIIDAREVADVVTFLASSKAIAINGDAVAVAGGVRGSIHY
jgi:NAD(P)-dependent dehydrogenase (short-subunit alcohol dehydrogenase family)